MVHIKRTVTVEEKLHRLSDDSRYDLACACAPRSDEHRRRSSHGRWIYPVSLPQGGRTYIFKTLLSNACRNDCLYCPLRIDGAIARISLSPEELAKTFMAYLKARRVSGLFLSSGVADTPDATMERINRTARILRKSRFRGYIHLKIIPGASDQAIRESLMLASAVSLNIECPQAENFLLVSKSKKYESDIMRPIRLISRLTARGERFSRVKQTTQFVVGAAGETDRQIIDRAGSLYSDLGLDRIYFSAYQPPQSTTDLFGETSSKKNHAMLTREHRLYQVDWLMRKYGFIPSEIPVDATGNLALDTDPKEMWARTHPQYFPLNVNKASRRDLLRVPGFGDVTVGRIFDLRAQKIRIKSLRTLGPMTKLMHKAATYVCF
jgi:predicted DNA-binding helix-hairpin-helix protein